MNFNYILIINILQIILLVILGLSTFYIFLFSFAGLFYRQLAYSKAATFRRIAVLIPGYKEDDVIIDVAMEALKQDYSSELFDVVIVIEVKFEKSTKSKALNLAMIQLPDKYDIAVVLDADNIMASDFLSKINSAFEHNYLAVQGHRTAKNVNTHLAILDAVSEEINNHIFRKGHRVLGFSSAIIGSGMAFKYDYFKNLMLSVTAIGGFDKEIELKMLKDRHKIEYLDDALVYDEKVQKADVFTNQRRRWLSAQLHYFKLDFGSSFKAMITKGNIDYFDKAIQFIQPPRILLLGAVLLLGTIFFLFNLTFESGGIFNSVWILITVFCVLTFLFSIPAKFYNLQTLKALATLPKGMFLMLGSFLKIKGANKQFIHTKHSAVKTTFNK